MRVDLVRRFAKSNNYPTARMYIDALHSFPSMTHEEAEQNVASMVDNKRLAGIKDCLVAARRIYEAAGFKSSRGATQEFRGGSIWPIWSLDLV